MIAQSGESPSWREVRRGRQLHRVGPAVIVLSLALAAPAIALGALALGGELSAPAQLSLGDPGALTRFGLPVARALRNVSSALCIGALVMSAVTFGTAEAAVRVRGVFLTVAAASGLAWLWAAAATLLLTYSSLNGASLFAAGGVDQFGWFTVNVDLGRALSLNLLNALAISLACLFVRSETGSFVLAVLAIAAQWPLAGTGHAASESNHDAAVYVQMTHLVAASVWIGGLAAVVLARHVLAAVGYFPTVGRFSRAAAICVVLLGSSGIAAAALRLESWRDLDTRYGSLLLAKAVTLVVLICAGRWQRARVLPALGRPGPDCGATAFVRLACLELTLMAVVLGLAVALSSTPPPG